jgi:hypothetical protein
MGGSSSREAGCDDAAGTAGTPWRGFVVLAVVLLVQVSPHWIPIADGPGYLSIARSLATGHGFTRLGSPHLFFAPGYPLVISPLFLASARPFLALALVHWALLMIFVAGSYVWARRNAPERAVAVALLTAVNVSVLYYFRRTASEALFMPWLVGSAILLDRLLHDRAERRCAGRLVAALAAVAGLCAIRQAGLALAVGFVWAAFLRVRAGRLPRQRALLYAAVIGLGSLLATVALALHDRAAAASSGGASYLDYTPLASSAGIAGIGDGLRLRIQEIGRILVPGAFRVEGGWLNPCMLVYLPVAGATAYGWFLAARRRADPWIWAVPAYVGLYVVWPFEQGTRFLTPLVPVLWLSLLELARVPPCPARFPRAIVVMVLLGAATAAVYLAKDHGRALRTARAWPTVEAIAAAIPAAVPVYATGIPGDLRPMLELALDRPVRAVASADKADPAGIVVARDAAAPPAGFEVVWRGDGYVLLRRPAGLGGVGRAHRPAREAAGLGVADELVLHQVEAHVAL